MPTEPLFFSLGPLPPEKPRSPRPRPHAPPLYASARGPRLKTKAQPPRRWGKPPSKTPKNAKQKKTEQYRPRVKSDFMTIPSAALKIGFRSGSPQWQSACPIYRFPPARFRQTFFFFFLGNFGRKLPLTPETVFFFFFFLFFFIYFCSFFFFFFFFFFCFFFFSIFFFFFFFFLYMPEGQFATTSQVALKPEHPGGEKT